MRRIVSFSDDAGDKMSCCDPRQRRADGEAARETHRLHVRLGLRAKVAPADCAWYEEYRRNSVSGSARARQSTDAKTDRSARRGRSS